MATIRGFGLALLHIQHSVAIQVSGGLHRAALPEYLAYVWEFEGAHVAPVGPSSGQWTPGEARPTSKPKDIYRQSRQGSWIDNQQCLKEDRVVWVDPPDQRLCYASPVERVVKDNLQQVDADVRKGRTLAQSMKIVFAGLVRDGECSVRASYDMWKYIGSHFKEHAFLIFESDSQDTTVERMREIQAEDPLYHFESEKLSYPDERDLEAGRLRRMAILRNRLHDMLTEFFARNADWDLVVMYDFDLNLNGAYPFSPHSLFGALGRQDSLRNKWDMLCANSIGHRSQEQASSGLVLYDCFAYRDAQNDTFFNYCEEERKKEPFAQFDLVPVHSCFGGLAIYKPDKLLGCRYDPDLYDCEHVGLHKCMRDKGSEGRMFLDPLLTTRYDPWTEYNCRISDL